MNTRLVLIVAVLALLLTGLVVATAGTQTSDNYAAERVLTNSNGAGEASSDNYAVQLTVGQTATGSAASNNYGVGLGFWYGAVPEEIFDDGFESGDCTEWSSAVGELP
jgi:hypothetical protein